MVVPGAGSGNDSKPTKQVIGWLSFPEKEDIYYLYGLPCDTPKGAFKHGIHLTLEGIKRMPHSKLLGTYEKA